MFYHFSHPYLCGLALLWVNFDSEFAEWKKFAHFYVIYQYLFLEKQILASFSAQRMSLSACFCLWKLRSFWHSTVFCYTFFNHFFLLSYFFSWILTIRLVFIQFRNIKCDFPPLKDKWNSGTVFQINKNNLFSQCGRQFKSNIFLLYGLFHPVVSAPQRSKQASSSEAVSFSW